MFISMLLIILSALAQEVGAATPLTLAELTDQMKQLQTDNLELKIKIHEQQESIKFNYDQLLSVYERLNRLEQFVDIIDLRTRVLRENQNDDETLPVCTYETAKDPTVLSKSIGYRMAWWPEDTAQAHHFTAKVLGTEHKFECLALKRCTPESGQNGSVCTDYTACCDITLNSPRDFRK